LISELFDEHSYVDLVTNLTSFQSTQRRSKKNTLDLTEQLNPDFPDGYLPDWQPPENDSRPKEEKFKPIDEQRLKP
jgi:hypothetical protein